MIMEGEEWTPCRCPKCKGFLPQDFPVGEAEQFQCRKCGAVLSTLPSIGEDDEEERDPEMNRGGRICIVPPFAIAIKALEFPKLRRKRKHKTDQWAMGEGFSRRVWMMQGVDFIEVNGERIFLTDPRIELVTTKET